MCRIVYLGIFTQCQYIPFKHANRRRILQRPIKIQWDTRSAHISIQHFFFQFCAGLILALKENLTMVILICESTYMYILQRVQTQARRLNYGTTLGQGVHSLHFSCPDIFSGPTLNVGRQTMVFTECKLRFSPLFYQFIKQKRLRPGTAWCNTWIVSNQTVQTLIKWSVTRHFMCVFSDYQTTRYGFPFLWVYILRVVKEWA